MNSSDTQNLPVSWNPGAARTLGAIAFIMPIIGALLYHVDSVSEIGQARFFMSVRGALIVGGLASMMFMPRAFRRILDSKGIADEHELYRRARTFHTSYKLTMLVTLILIVIAGFAANEGLGGRDMRNLLVTVGMLVVVYSMVIPFNILAWTMIPPDEE